MKAAGARTIPAAVTTITIPLKLVHDQGAKEGHDVHALPASSHWLTSKSAGVGPGEHQRQHQGRDRVPVPGEVIEAADVEPKATRSGDGFVLSHGKGEEAEDDYPTETSPPAPPMIAKHLEDHPGSTPRHPTGDLLGALLQKGVVPAALDNQEL